jgi:hypothetical protein
MKSDWHSNNFASGRAQVKNRVGVLSTYALGILALFVWVICWAMLLTLRRRPRLTMPV